MADSKPLVVMIAGLPRKGKSTALNNIFSLNFEARLAAKSVTRKFTATTVTKEKLDPADDTIKEKIDLIVIDTPGMEATDIDTETAIKDVKEHVKYLNFILIYCLSVSRSGGVIKADQQVIATLTKCFHKKIWSRCILLLTYSDEVREKELTEDTMYREFLGEHSERFQEALEANGVHCNVKTMFEYAKVGSVEIQLHDITINSNDIVAVPVAKEATTNDIMPGVNFQHMRDWTNVVYYLLLMKVDPTDRPRFLDFKLAGKTAGGCLLGATAGILGGGRVGIGIGAVGGPGGMALGALIGGAVGAVGGAVGGGTAVSAYKYHKWKEADPDKQMTKLLKKIEEDKKDREKPKEESTCVV